MSQPPLRIAIDASRSVSHQPTGTEIYSRRLIQALIAANERQANPAQLSLYFRDRPPAKLFADSAYVQQQAIPLPRLWTHLGLAAAIWKTRPDLSFVPAHTLPLVFPGAAALTVHDLGFKRFPQAHPPLQRAYLEASTRFSQARAQLIFADSRATATDLQRFYGTPSAKIRVVYPGIDQETPSLSRDDIDAVRAKYELPPRYFLFVGTLQPRKNIGRLVKAFARWQSLSGDEETALVLAGAKGWLYDERWLMGSRQVSMTGYISEVEKHALLAGAMALVFPSLYEGFGFPALEAMRAGTPVIASNTSSLAEIVADCGLQVDPLDIEAIASAMSRISEDQPLRAELIAGGYQRVRQFSWAESARQALDALNALWRRA